MAIIGRPNVGKSALFNRLVGKRRALVDSTPGVTRDRLYGDVQWRGLRFRVVDTGGLQFEGKPGLSEAVASQVAKAVEEASLVLFVGDAREGLLPLDQKVASWLHPRGKPILLAVNKVDSEKEDSAVYEFSSLGFGSPIPISGLHGRRINDLLDAIVEQLEKAASSRPSSDPGSKPVPIRIAIVGRPNVGKSSLINRILNEDRVVVDETPGTTRDPVEVTMTYRGKPYLLVDTAGVRSRRRLKSRVDAVSRLKALEVIQGVDLCLGVLEAPMGIVQEDLKLLSQVVTAGKSLFLVLNKWDLLRASPDAEQAAHAVARRAHFLRNLPVICTSAKTGFGVQKLLDQAERIVSLANRRVTRDETDQLLKKIQSDPRAPAAIRNAHLFRLIQVGTAPPTFHLLARLKHGFRASDLAYLEGVLRRGLKLEETPIRVRLLTGRK